MLDALLASPWTVLVCALLLLRGLSLVADRLTPWRARIEVPWGLPAVLIAWCGFFSAILILQGIAVSLLHPDQEQPVLSVTTASAIQVAAQTFALLIVAHFAWHGCARSTIAAGASMGAAGANVGAAGANFGATCASLGLQRRGTARALLLGCLAFFPAIPLIQALYVFWSDLWFALQGSPLPTQATLDRVRAVEDPLSRAFVHFTAGVFAPIAEELIWRAFVQPVFVRALGPLRGIALTSFFFVVLGHGTEVYLPLFGFSLMLGWIYWRTGRIVAPMALHAALNLSTLFLPVLLQTAEG